jgi:hypothetical protein
LPIGGLACNPPRRFCLPGRFSGVFGQEPAQFFTSTRQKSFPVPPGELTCMPKQSRLVPWAVQEKSEGDKMSGHFSFVHFFLLA